MPELQAAAVVVLHHGCVSITSTSSSGLDGRRQRRQQFGTRAGGRLQLDHSQQQQQLLAPEVLLAGLHLHLQQQHQAQRQHVAALPFAWLHLGGQRQCSPAEQQPCSMQLSHNHNHQNQQQQQPLFSLAELAPPRQQQQPNSHPHQQPPFSSLSRRSTQQQQQQPQQQQQQQQERNKLRTRGLHESPATAPGALAVEADGGGRQRVYRSCSGVDTKSGRPWEGFDMVRDCVCGACVL
jgi:hypothetical protein